jgi:hypothetical protein
MLCICVCTCYLDKVFGSVGAHIRPHWQHNGLHSSLSSVILLPEYLMEANKQVESFCSVYLNISQYLEVDIIAWIHYFVNNKSTTLPFIAN